MDAANEQDQLVDRIIDELSKEGTSAGTGEFTLDFDAAVARMRQYQLPDPRQYVLLLVQAMVLKGAYRVEFRIDANDMLMEALGAAFTRGELETLYQAALRAAVDDDSRACSHLAVALHAAGRLVPDRILVESQGRSGSTQIAIHPGRPWVCQGIETGNDLLAAGEPTRTAVRVKEPLSMGTVGRFVQNGNLPEEIYLRRHCRWSSIDVTLDGKRVADPGLGVVTGLGNQRFFQDDAMRLRAFEASGPAVRVLELSEVQGKLRILTHGIEVRTEPLRWGLADAGFGAIVDCRLLRKDLSCLDIVEDDQYRRVIETVRCVLCDIVDADWPKFEKTAWGRSQVQAPRQGLLQPRDFVIQGDQPLFAGVKRFASRMAQQIAFQTLPGGTVTLKAILKEVRGGHPLAWVDRQAVVRQGSWSAPNRTFLWLERAAGEVDFLSEIPGIRLESGLPILAAALTGEKRDKQRWKTIVDNLANAGAWSDLWSLVPVVSSGRAAGIARILEQAGWVPEDASEMKRYWELVQLARRSPEDRSVRKLQHWTPVGIPGCIPVRRTDGNDAAVRFTPNGGLVVASWDGKIRITRPDGIAADLPDAVANPICIDIDPAGRRLAVGYYSTELRVWDLHQWEVLHDWPGGFHERTVNGVSFSTDGRWLASGCGDGMVRIFSTSDWSTTHSFREPQWAATPLFVGGEFLATGNGRNVVRLSRISDWTEVAAMAGHTTAIVCMAASRDGHLLASGDQAGILRLWEIPSGVSRGVFPLAGGVVRCAAFHPGGRILAAGCWDGKIRFLEPVGGRILKVLDAVDPETEGVVGLAFSPDGTRLATVGNSGTVSWAFDETRLAE